MMASCSGPVFLTTDAKFLDQRTVLVDVVAFQVFKQTFPFSNHHDEAATGSMVLLEFVEMLGKAFDTVGKKCDLTFNGAGVVLVTAVLCEDFLLLLES